MQVGDYRVNCNHCILKITSITADTVDFAEHDLQLSGEFTPTGYEGSMTKSAFESLTISWSKFCEQTHMGSYQ